LVANALVLKQRRAVSWSKTAGSNGGVGSPITWLYWITALQMPTDSRLSTDDTNTARWRLLMRALRSRNYRLFFEGQIVSLIGTWMTRVATSWLVYRLTGSAFFLGLTGFASQIPILFLTLFACGWTVGIVIARW
jgi:hypothetical protein